MKHSYAQMIVEAIIALNERKGASRQSIWKYVASQYPDTMTQQKIFAVQLRRLSHDATQVVKKDGNAFRYILNKNFKDRLMRAMSKGDSIVLAQKHALTTKSDKANKGAKKNNKAKMSKTAKGKKTLQKSKDKAAAKAKAEKAKTKAMKEKKAGDKKDKKSMTSKGKGKKDNKVKGKGNKKT